ncbi:hypothetical protein BB561_000392 [Smittium simulii]|uniref:Uncharacterized protein n=1 Tax=Smittium simulii TaxID=133385 RepID=A0A2T9YZI1_9FUNG|nr:hypothetical protein BB561_000392 [Smittium simulii]
MDAEKTPNRTQLITAAICNQRNGLTNKHANIFTAKVWNSIQLLIQQLNHIADIRDELAFCKNLSPRASTLTINLELLPSLPPYSLLSVHYFNTYLNKMNKQDSVPDYINMADTQHERMCTCELCTGGKKR